MPAKTPLAIVNDTFGSKDKLVDKVVGLLASTTDEPKEELKKRLTSAANGKLLRLHKVASTINEKYGSREKLVTATATAMGKAKDKDFVAKLDTLSVGQLLDKVTAAERRAKRAAAKKN